MNARTSLTTPCRDEHARAYFGCPASPYLEGYFTKFRAGWLRGDRNRSRIENSLKVSGNFMHS